MGASQEAQRYIENEDVVEPSVITLNVLSASQAINDFLMMFTGLYAERMPISHILHDLLQRERFTSEVQNDNDCLHCSNHKRSSFAKGDRATLPCRQA
jgi:hypothetical protein